jgi:hypothetical protein
MNTSVDLHAIEAELKARYKPGLDPWGFDVDVFMKGIRLPSTTVSQVLSRSRLWRRKYPARSKIYCDF